jgi:hypothetical protein
MVLGSQVDPGGHGNINPIITEFLESNYDVERFKNAVEQLLMLTKADFIEIMTKNLKGKNGEEIKKRKDRLNILRVFLGQTYITTFKLDDKSYVIGNRTSPVEMANDCWYLSVSIKNNKMENECFETIFKTGGNNLNKSQLNESSVSENECNSRLAKISNEVESMKTMIENLVSNNNLLLQLNKELMQEVKSIKTENQSLRKLVLEHSTNQSINRETRRSESSLDSVVGKRRRPDIESSNPSVDNVFKIPQSDLPMNTNTTLLANNRKTFSSILEGNKDKTLKTTNERKKSMNKAKMIIGKGNGKENGLNVATRNHHFYVGNLHVDTTIKAVEEYVNNFAKVERIHQLKTKHRYYSSFYIEVNEKFNEKMNDPSNWPSNVRIKRFFHGKNSKLDEHIINGNENQNMDTSGNNIPTSTVSL